MTSGNTADAAPTPTPDVQRLLIYAMQSSGASLFALFAGQSPGTLTVPDLWNPEITPHLGGRSVVVKATVGTVPLPAHRRSFLPTRTLLYLRHPVDVATSLATKSYRDYGGTIADKLRIFDEIVADEGDFDLTVSYEELVADPAAVADKLRAIGHPMPEGAERFPRSPDEIVRHACASSGWCVRNFRTKWGLGNIHVDALEQLGPIASKPSEEAWSSAWENAPRLLARYEQASATVQPRTAVPAVPAAV